MNDDLKHTTKAHDEIVRALAGFVQSDETYRLIGRFVHEFSQVEMLFRYILFEMLQAPADVFDEVMSAYDVALLCNAAKAVSKKRNTTRDHLTLEAYANEFLALNGERVRIVHGTWMKTNTAMWARHVSRHKFEPNLHYGMPGELSSLVEKAASLSNRLANYLVSPRST